LVVRDFDFLGIALLPPETDAVLIVNSDTVLSRSNASESLKSIAGGSG
jgi:hypothetical protein